MANCPHDLNPKTCRICLAKAAARRNDKADQFNRMLDNCIAHLGDDSNRKAGVEELREIASWCKTAGFSRARWLQLCSYIEAQAVARSSEHLVQDKIKLAIRDANKLTLSRH